MCAASPCGLSVCVCVRVCVRVCVCLFVFLFVCLFVGLVHQFLVHCGQDEASDDDIARVLTQLLLARPEAEPTLSLDRSER